MGTEEKEKGSPSPKKGRMHLPNLHNTKEFQALVSSQKEPVEEESKEHKILPKR